LFQVLHKGERHTAVLSVGRLIGSFDTVAAGCFPMNPAATDSLFAWYQEGGGKSESLSCASATTKGSLFVVAGTAPLSLPLLAQRPEAMFASHKKAIGF
jgi:hypothetical protein